MRLMYVVLPLLHVTRFDHASDGRPVVASVATCHSTPSREYACIAAREREREGEGEGEV